MQRVPVSHDTKVTTKLSRVTEAKKYKATVPVVGRKILQEFTSHTSHKNIVPVKNYTKLPSTGSLLKNRDQVGNTSTLQQRSCNTDTDHSEGGLSRLNVDAVSTVPPYIPRLPREEVRNYHSKNLPYYCHIDDPVVGPDGRNQVVAPQTHREWCPGSLTTESSYEQGKYMISPNDSKSEQPVDEKGTAMATEHVGASMVPGSRVHKPGCGDMSHNTSYMEHAPLKLHEIKLQAIANANCEKEIVLYDVDPDLRSSHLTHSSHSTRSLYICGHCNIEVDSEALLLNHMHSDYM